jgi:hypothetical protein
VLFIFFDLASDRTNPRTGFHLVNQFLELYKLHYVDGQKPPCYPPIFIKARETTSYPLLVPFSKLMSRRLGINVEHVEIAREVRMADEGTENPRDVMHHVLLVKKDD